jgi:poly(3-hydroxybutyrate) depolymerase
MNKKLLRIFSALLLFPLLPIISIPTTVHAAHPSLTSLFEAKIYDDGVDTLPYRIYVPEDYDSKKSYPLILFFHGAGERGNDNAAQLKNAVGQMFNSPNSPVYDCIVIAPQCPAGSQWVNVNGWTDTQYSTDKIPESKPLKTALKILESVKKEYNVDTDRIYTTGLSMGGYATWDLLVRHTDLFAAAIPICGGADYRYAEKLVDVPIYTFHGLRDQTVPFSGTERMVSDILDAGGEKITYVTYPDMDHIIWETAFATDGLFEWLLDQRLSDRIKAPAEDVTEESTTVTPTPEESTPEESTPEESTPEESLPEESVPEESTPEESIPEESVPEETVPAETVPAESESEEETDSDSAPVSDAPSDGWVLPGAVGLGIGTVIGAALGAMITYFVLKKKK